MPLFKILLLSTGLSTRECADFLNVARDTIKKWCSDKAVNTANEGVIKEINALIDLQTNAVNEALDLIEVQPSDMEIKLHVCEDDKEAQALGLPFKTAHDAVNRRIIEYLTEEQRKNVVL